MPACPSRDPFADLIRRGDPEAIARGLLPVARRFAARVLGPSDDHLIATAAHDAVLAVCRYSRSYRGTAKVSSWLFTITRRAAGSLARRETLHFSRLARDSFDDLGDGAFDHPSVNARREAMGILESAVPNRRWREVWLFWNDPDIRPTHEEVAERTGYTAASVEVILSRVRGSLSRASDARTRRV